MIGEFHLMNSSSGLRSDKFFPLRTPVPALAIRNIVPSDIAFMNPSGFSTVQRIEFLNLYKKRFKGTLDE